MKHKGWLFALPLAAAGGLLLGGALRTREEKALEPLWNALSQPGDATPFDPVMLDGLPPPAQRYLRHAIAPGTPLAPAVRLTMHGAMRLQPGADPIPMQAEQILAPPRGLVWKARVGSGATRIRGFDRYGDGAGAMRWWLWGIVPLVRASGPDVTRSAAGRVAGEAILMPPALLPQQGAVWEAVDDRTARVHLQVDGERVASTLTVDDEGRLERVRVARWREGDKARPAGYAPFDVDEFGGWRTFGGYTIPTRFRAGWGLDEKDAFAFFYADIDTARYY